MAEVTSEKKKGKRKSEVLAAPASTEPAADESMAVDEAEPAAKKKKEKVREPSVDPETLSPIAHPLANRKLTKHVLRAVKKGSKQRHIRRGVKEVVKSLRKGEKGMVVMAADISPMDILTHIPLLAEESGCAYIFVPSKELLGQASATKRPTSCIMIVPEIKKGGNKKVPDPTDPEKLQELQEYREAYTEIVKEVEAVDETGVVY